MTQRLTRFTAFALLALGDVIFFNLTFIAAYQILPFVCAAPEFNTYRELVFWAWVLPPAAFYLAGLYRTADEYVFTKSAQPLFAGVFAALMTILAVIWLLRGRLLALETRESLVAMNITEAVWGFPTRVLLFAAVAGPLALWLWRELANRLERRLIGWSARPRRLLVLGDLPVGDRERLVSGDRPRYAVIGRLGGREECPEWPNLGEIEQLGEVLDRERPDEVLLVAGEVGREILFAAARECFARRVRPRLVLGVYEAQLAATQARLWERLAVLQAQPAEVRGWPLVAKRLLDVFLAGAALTLTAPLVILPACVAIVIDSKGWPLFTQTRVGLGGRHFKLYKLRTMVVDAARRGGPLTADRDPRITRLGHFLRRTSIDELPQFWNVLKGDMSLVGPRAVVPFVVENFADWERLSLAVRPGITGLAQISGRDEIGFREKSLLNLYYVRNFSLWLDLRILVETVSVVLSMEGTGGTRRG